MGTGDREGELEAGAGSALGCGREHSSISDTQEQCPPAGTARYLMQGQGPGSLHKDGWMEAIDINALCAALLNYGATC